MKTSLFLIALLALPAFAQEPTTSPGTAALPNDSPRAMTTPAGSTMTSPAAASTSQAPTADQMMQMMELMKTNENHKLLADLDGTWDYTLKFSPAPGAPEQQSKGTAVRKSIMGGRYVVMDVTGKIKMPGADGKLKEMEFKGQGTEGYDNAKKKFVGSWIDNMSTGILMSEGDYDAGSKAFTYTAEMEMAPGMKTKVREVMKVVDKNHMSFEWYEDRGGQEAKTMEINYTRRK